VSAAIERRARIARVRRVQHLQAAADAARADGRVQHLENTADHLAQLTRALSPGPGALSGAALGNAAELAARLDTVRHGLAGPIADARSAALAGAMRRMEARIAQETAERLETRAHEAAALLRERRLAAVHRPRLGKQA